MPSPARLGTIAGEERRDWVAAAVFLVIGFVAIVVGVELARPFRGAGIAFDSQVSVLHFDRLITGRQLQEGTTVTSKPLLTVVFGLLHHATGGWHAISYATIAAYAVGSTATALLAWRLGGPIAAGVAGLGTAMSARLLFDTGQSLATPWALPFWAAAGLALTGGSPRYALAGALLAVATLARLETGLIALTALVILAGLAVLRRPAPRAAGTLPLFALAAVPVLLLHDLLLTADPLRWTKVAGMFSQLTERHVMTPVEVAALIVHERSPIHPLTILAAIGLVRLAMHRQWGVVLGLVGLGPVLLVALIVMAARGIYVDKRYLAAPELATILAAAVGAAGLRLTGVTWPRWRRWGVGILRRARSSRLTAASVGALLAVVLVQPYWWQDPSLRGTIRRVSQLGAETDRAVPVLRAVLAAADTTGGPPRVAPIIVPSHVRFRVAMDVGAAESRVGGLQLSRFDLAAGYPRVGQVVMYHRLAATPGTPPTVLETTSPVEADGVRLQPLLADEASGLFIIRIASPPSP